MNGVISKGDNILHGTFLIEPALNLKIRERKNDVPDMNETEEKREKRCDIELDMKLNKNSMISHISEMIDDRRCRAYSRVNQEMMMMFWEIGRHLNSVVLGNKNAEYFKKILTELSTKLATEYGAMSFTEQNLYRMMLFAERFTDLEILSELTKKLSWSHFIELLPVESEDAMLYYARETIEHNFSLIELHRQIMLKAYECREVAKTDS
ncbi:MAG: DUF1016 N-terminal domain-containing protein [Methanomassiliicoccaceae archaeon]|jgi:hypothetical protein|nr:DUF1016 N-terminal domain-containing protein [Methanomassiliicoccaceae archaeon]